MSAAITCSPVPTARASKPSRISPANSASATLTESGTAGRLVSISTFWYFLRTAVPCLVVFLAVHPSTYRTAGLRRGTATSTSTSPGTTSSTARAAVQRNQSDRLGVIPVGAVSSAGSTSRAFYEAGDRVRRVRVVGPRLPL